MFRQYVITALRSFLPSRSGTKTKKRASAKGPSAEAASAAASAEASSAEAAASTAKTDVFHHMEGIDDEGYRT